VTIKRLESMLLDEAINLRSKDLLSYYSDSKIKHNANDGTFEKTGRSLKIGDVVRDLPDNKLLKVVGFAYESRLSSTDLVEGEYYDVAVARAKKICRCRLVEKNQTYDWYRFMSDDGARDISGSFDQLPPVYQDGMGRIVPTQIAAEVNGSRQDFLSFDDVADKTFQLDMSDSHAVVAIG
jgi:hypothetical protein